MSDLRGDEVIPIGSTVLQRVTTVDIAHKWLRDNSLCAIDWEALEELVSIYRKYGAKTIVFDTKNVTYTLRDKIPDPSHSAHALS